MQTRRDWVLSVGQAAAGMSIAWPLAGSTSSPAALPPGVYLPSRDDLGHALMSADKYHPIPPGCPTDYVRPSEGPYRPLSMSAAEFAFTCCLTRVLLGDVSQAISEDAAEWIGLCIASEAGVRRAEARVDPAYKALAAAYYGADHGSESPADAAQVFRNGLSWISQSAKSRYGGEFESLQPDEQVEILHSISDGRSDTSAKNPGTRLFAFLKTEVTKAFYTSRAGLDELQYKGNAFYAVSPGCPSKSGKL
ncbi:MAG TPA: gluconate 2-dehydrogenase subunit 3 family protein [Bryobacteraceae bacterium]|nr:gluconate 2-dehydrogenase subunit 3 family protein [Bryobacteraceae bacterium]